MKWWIIVLIIILAIFGLSRVVTIMPSNLPGPKIEPDSKLYFLKIWWEKVVIFFTFDAESRAERYKAFAEKRAAEAKEMALQGKMELANKLKDTYNRYLNKAKDALNKAIQDAI
ncbi:MAG: DUF5667 domain-containing protein, partial [Nanoarchaeota archaeon]|nr:DUF5667 domain-containing protein [Nanoarchaeota archaeon]